jgi:hypothetical protein
MSKFKTSIPVDVDSIKGALPKGAFIEGVTWNQDAGAVELRWSHGAFKTPFDYAVEFTPDDLLSHNPPKGVRVDIVRLRACGAGGAGAQPLPAAPPPAAPEESGTIVPLPEEADPAPAPVAEPSAPAAPSPEGDSGVQGSALVPTGDEKRAERRPRRR